MVIVGSLAAGPAGGAPGGGCRLVSAGPPGERTPPAGVTGVQPAGPAGFGGPPNGSDVVTVTGPRERNSRWYSYRSDTAVVFVELTTSPALLSLPSCRRVESWVLVSCSPILTRDEVTRT